MHLSEGNPFKTCANPLALNQRLNQENLYENEMIETYRDLNSSEGASPTISAVDFSFQKKRVPAIILEMDHFSPGCVWVEHAGLQVEGGVDFSFFNTKDVALISALQCIQIQTHNISCRVHT